jgi:hypothetical protein
VTLAEKQALKRAFAHVREAQEHLSRGTCFADRPHFERVPEVVAAAEFAEQALQDLRQAIVDALGDHEVTE